MKTIILIAFLFLSFSAFSTPDPVTGKVLASDSLSASEMCYAGQRDVDLYHGKAFKHGTLGLFFGPFAVLGAYMGNPAPEKDIETIASVDESTRKNADYRRCYKKEAKEKNALNAAIGMLVEVTISTIIYFSTTEE